jgi:hypothetical protein
VQTILRKENTVCADDTENENTVSADDAENENTVSADDTENENTENRRYWQCRQY